MDSLYLHIQSKILNWYHQFGRRHLPWRNTTDPYAIYVSEVMLQQTQVKTVLTRFYDPFLNRFPTLSALKEASEQDVLKQWEGLGYYSRARYLHQTAVTCAPQLPSSIEALQALPGIGKNTAHAIASFAFGQKVPIMEANVKRILCRFFAIKNPKTKQLWALANSLLNRSNTFDHNQAMMDIGSEICTAKQPKCEICPLNQCCQGKNSPDLFPQKKQKSPLPIRKRLIIVLYNVDGHLYLIKRKSRFLNGLFGFIEVDNLNTPELTGDTKIGQVQHTYSHFTLDATVYISKPHHGVMPIGGEWFHQKTIESLPLSGADKKVLKLIHSTRLT